MTERDPSVQTTTSVAADDALEGAADLGRREALERLGKLSAYTAPVALTLLLSSKRAAASDPGGPPVW